LPTVCGASEMTSRGTLKASTSTSSRTTFLLLLGWFGWQIPIKITVMMTSLLVLSERLSCS